MSFTADVKDELTRVIPTCSHCDKATLAAIARIEGTLLFSGPGRYKLEIATEISSVARLVIRSLHTLYKLKTELTVRRSVLHKTPNYLITVPSQPNLEPALHDLGILAKTGIEMGILPHLVEKTCCAAAYLRGAFLGSGFIAEPRGDFHFEITVESEELANGLVQLMSDRDINARVLHRRNSYIVYLKSGEAISEFLAFVGAHQCALAMENERVRKSVRNEINRKVNAEVANQAKSADIGNLHHARERRELHRAKQADQHARERDHAADYRKQPPDQRNDRENFKQEPRQHNRNQQHQPLIGAVAPEFGPGPPDQRHEKSEIAKGRDHAVLLHVLGGKFAIHIPSPP